MIGALVVSFIVYALVRPERGSVSGGSNGGTATTNSRTSASIAAGQTQTLSALDLRAGDCYNQAELPPADGSTVPISSVELTSCESAHNAQVIARVVYKITDDYDDVRNNKAGPACDQEFRAKAQPNVLADIAYQSVILSPADQGSWTSRPIVACVLFTEIPHPGSVLIA